MKIKEIEERLAAIAVECETDGADLEALRDEAKQLNEERAAKIAEIEQRKLDEKRALETKDVIKSFENDEKKDEERKMAFDYKTPEYRDAFLAMMVGKETAEQRAIFADNTNFGDGIALPAAVQDAIYDQICSEHPILADIEMVRSGIVMKIPQITPTVPGSKKDSAASAEMTYTTVDVVLAGKDYHTYIEISYAEREMSSVALEARIKNEIGVVLGEAMAKDVFARMLSDAGSAAVTKGAGNTYFECLKTALAAASLASNPVVYAPASLYYTLLGETDTNGQPIFRNGIALNAPIKLDNGATKITVVEPKKFFYNVIADIRTSTQDDTRAAKIVIGGYARAEGCMTVKKAVAYVG